MNSASRRLPAAQLKRFTADALLAVGLPAKDAATCAELMARADLQGADGHGIFRLPQYVRRIKGGAVNVKPKVKVAREAAGMALVDGDNGMGHVVMSFAAKTAIAKAKTAGAAWVGVARSNHAGPASLYAAMPLAHDMIGLYLAVGNANHMAPWGGIDLLLSTNPIAVAAPGDETNIVLDMATTVAAYGKVKTAVQRGETLPEGWMIDHQGRPLTDPKRADQGLLVPIGGYKGYGLALVFGLLAGTLNGAAMGSETVDFNADDVTPTNTGHAIVAISIAAFGDVNEFKRRVDKLAREIRGSKPMPGVARIWLPGEQSRAKFEERSKLGIPIPEPLRAGLDKLARELKIKALEFRGRDQS
ncbi:MAG TPA: Ldh family oxidoreductase [Burkholderiales bacterium]|nr:Ldh family oxidoreductase [Burkholderiales bacterium]